MSTPSHASKQTLPPHPIPPEAAAYVASFTPAQRDLHELAVKMLGSSYFVERTHGFAKWKAAQATAQQPPNAQRH
jgi:hypothetical protein